MRANRDEWHLEISSNCRRPLASSISVVHGRHAVALAERGSAVVAVDFADRLLRRARHLACDARVSVLWIRGDMGMLPLQNECADAGLITDSFGFFETETEDEAVVREARRILRDFRISHVEGRQRSSNTGCLSRKRARATGRRRGVHFEHVDVGPASNDTATHCERK